MSSSAAEYGTFARNFSHVSTSWRNRLFYGVGGALLMLAFIGIRPRNQVGELYFSIDSTNTPDIQEIFVWMEDGSPQYTFGNRDSIKLRNTPKSSAVAKFNDSLLQVGWSKLWVQAQSKNMKASSIQEAHFLAGYAEGALTHHRIDQHYNNKYAAFFQKDQQAPKKVWPFFEENLDWIRMQISYHEHCQEESKREYWRALGNIVSRFDGLVAGYRAHTRQESPRTATDLLFLNADGDLEDLIPALNKTRTREPGQLEQNMVVSFIERLKSLKCSALIRVLPNNTDLLWGHTTWDTYSAMNRIYKFVDLPHASSKKRMQSSFSSSPGFLGSIDDFYILDNGLSIIETTNGLYRSDLYQMIVPSSVLTWMRALVANDLADNGKDWARVFKQYNSGTYNNQWMVLDYKKFVPGQALQNGLLTVVEQIPGTIVSEDVTPILQSESYWGSYNVPYFSSIYNLSGFNDMYERSNYSSSWSHKASPRANIFRRDAKAVSTLSDLKNLLRYNDWKNDPLSENDPANAIASRYDLEIDDTFDLNGGIDTKVTSFKLANSLKSEAINGPTRQNNPAFSWLNVTIEDIGAAHDGQPSTFEFDFEQMGPL